MGDNTARSRSRTNCTPKAFESNLKQRIALAREKQKPSPMRLIEHMLPEALQGLPLPREIDRTEEDKTQNTGNNKVAKYRKGGVSKRGVAVCKNNHDVVANGEKYDSWEYERVQTDIPTSAPSPFAYVLATVKNHHDMSGSTRVDPQEDLQRGSSSPDTPQRKHSPEKRSKASGGYHTAQCSPQSPIVEPSSKPVKCQAVTEGSSATDGRSNQPAASNNEHSPLEDIKLWSMDFFREQHPDIMEDVEADDANRIAFATWSRDHEAASDAGTRSISGLSSLPSPKEELTALKHNQWLHYAGQLDTSKDAVSLGSYPVRFQRSSHGRKVRKPDTHLLEDAHRHVGYELATFIDEWIQNNVDLHAISAIDTSGSDFLLGHSRPSALQDSTFTTAPDALFYPFTPPDIGPIDWDAIPVLPPINKDLLTFFQKFQTSELCTTIMLSKLREKIADIQGLKNGPDKPQLPKPRLSLPIPDDLTIRGARIGDMSTCTFMYNHYVGSSLFTLDKYPSTILSWETLRHDAEANGQHFLVAVQPSGGVVGFGVVSPFSYDRNNIFEGVVKLRVYVHPGSQRRGVGSKLLDRLLSSLDPSYRSRYAYRYEYKAGLDHEIYNPLFAGNMGIASKIVVDVLFGAEASGEYEWRKQFLERFGFNQISTPASLGENRGQAVKVASFMREALNLPHEQSVLTVDDEA